MNDEISFSNKPVFKPNLSPSFMELKCLLNKMVKNKFYALLIKFNFSELANEDTKELSNLLITFSEKNPFFNEMYAHFSKILISKLQEEHPQFAEDFEKDLGKICGSKIVGYLKSAEISQDQEILLGSLSLSKFVAELFRLELLGEGELLKLLNEIKSQGENDIKYDHLALMMSVIGDRLTQTENIDKFFQDFHQSLLSYSYSSPKGTMLKATLLELKELKFEKSEGSKKLFLILLGCLLQEA